MLFVQFPRFEKTDLSFRVGSIRPHSFLGGNSLLQIDVEEVLVHLNLFELSTCLQRFCIFVSQNHALVRLQRLLCYHYLNLDWIGRFLYIVKFLDFINILVIEGVFEHFASV